MRDNWIHVAPLRAVARACALTLAACFLLPLALPGCGKQSDTHAEPEPVGGPTVLRRLTESQYRATVADIFGPDIPVPARFERGLRVDGLLAIGSGESGMSPFSIEQYDAAALSIATTVLVRTSAIRIYRVRLRQLIRSLKIAPGNLCSATVYNYGGDRWPTPR
ncbi:MAG: DUF1587 domain-containing protein [Haliea sp.]|nr:DUF1587 domain-containing protein [Haliea sp.]